MAQLFTKRANIYPLYLLFTIIFVIIFIGGAIWYWGSPYYTDVGYQPEQPVLYTVINSMSVNLVWTAATVTQV